MVKLDYSRDYYSDLELSPAADVNDVKKQFRKLALKYHPDRNPGREAEVNSKFQTIQSAHEILTSPDQKSKYDAHRKARFPAASGVRGNPWQDVASQYPAPPKRPAMNRKTASGAQRYSTFGVPPTAKAAKEDPNTRYQAWEDMRPKSRGKTGPAPTAPRTPRTDSRAQRPTTRPEPMTMPRTASQQQKASASFGTARRQGFVPQSPGPDEPPVASTNYSTTRHQPSLFSNLGSSVRKNQRATSSADPLNMFRDSTADPRQSTPYQTHGGEKLNPFEGADLHRSGSTRETPTKQQNTANTGRARSSSVPDIPESPTPAARNNANRKQEDTNAKFAGPSTSRFGDRYRPQNQGKPATAAFTAPNSSTTSLNSDTTTAGSSNAPPRNPDNPSVYATSDSYSLPTPQPFIGCRETNPPVRVASDRFKVSKRSSASPEMRECDPKTRPSGHEGCSRHNLNAFEQKQFAVLSGLLNQSPVYDPNATPKPPRAQQADNKPRSSFTFKVDDDTFAKTQPDATRFTRDSAENINTRFVAEEHANTNWEFSAGNIPHQSGSPLNGRRSQSGSRLGRRSPGKDRAKTRTTPIVSEEQATDGGAQPAGFNAGEWTEKLGSEHFFVPPPPPKTSSSPARGPRPVKKPRPVRATRGGGAGLVDDEDTSSEERSDSATANSASGVDSPVAMDIDPPTSPSASGVPTTEEQQSSTARNIPVEPERADWRAGNVNGLNANAKAKSGPSINLPTNNAAGSEDTDDFRASFADFRKTEPFAEAAAGLDSFKDLKSNLPFESKASTKAPVPRAKPRRITFPIAPVAPRPPPALAVPSLKPSTPAWEKYVREFHDYMQAYAVFNGQYVDHFQARRNTIEKQRRGDDGTGMNGFAWLATTGDDGIHEYLDWLEQDNEVRTKWASAAAEHEMRVREFALHRERMKQ